MKKQTFTKIAIAEELLKNTTNKHLKDFIAKYVFHLQKTEENKKDLSVELLRLDDCVSYLDSSKFNITEQAITCSDKHFITASKMLTDWKLFEIPIAHAHVFSNPRTKESFDLAVFEGKVTPRYIDSGCSERDASSIEEAIEKYDSIYN